MPTDTRSVFIFDRTEACDVLVAFGEIDLVNASEFQRALDRWSQPSRPLIIDLRACTYIDSTGLRIIFEFMKTKPELRLLANPTGTAARLIEIFGLSRYLDLTYTAQTTAHTIAQVSDENTISSTTAASRLIA